MKKTILTYLTLILCFIGHDQALANEELLSLLNQIESSEKLVTLDMGIIAQQEFSITLDRLKNIDQSKLSEFQISFKDQLVQRVQKNLEQKFKTLSSCEFIQKRHSDTLTAMVDKKLKNGEDFISQWQRIKLVKLDIENNDKCPNLKKLWTIIDSIEEAKFI